VTATRNAGHSNNVQFCYPRRRQLLSYGVGILPSFVCVSVVLHDISKTDAARITKFDKEMFHDESWKRIYFVVKRSRSRGTKNSAGVG